MTLAVFHKLLAVFLTMGLGFAAARLRWFGEATPASARLLGNLTFNLFVAALLFRTTARMDFARMPWPIVVAYFVPVLLASGAVYLLRRRHLERDGAAAPAAHALAVAFGNSVQLGIPIAAALFGEEGLALHIPLVSVHALIVLTFFTIVAEIELAHAHARRQEALPLARVLRSTLRNTLVHPVVLPVVAGILWNLGGLGLHPVVDEALALLGSAVVPLCLVLIGITLAAYGLAGDRRRVVAICAAKLVLLPAVVFATAHWGFGLAGVPLAVAVMMAALPVGTNPLIFAQRYAVLETEVTAAIVLSTGLFFATGAAWLGVLAWFASGSGA